MCIRDRVWTRWREPSICGGPRPGRRSGSRWSRSWRRCGPGYRRWRTPPTRWRCSGPSPPPCSPPIRPPTRSTSSTTTSCPTAAPVRAVTRSRPARRPVPWRTVPWRTVPWRTVPWRTVRRAPRSPTRSPRPRSVISGTGRCRRGCRCCRRPSRAPASGRWPAPGSWSRRRWWSPRAHLPLAGLLLILPALAATGLTEAFAATYGRLRNACYGLRSTVLMLLFLALLRDPRAEGATRIRPADLGRLLGLDRAPEVKTLRRKFAELAACGRGAQLQGALATHHATTRPDAVGFLFLDGHVRVYTGTRALPKTHIARMRIAGPATEETWVGDADWDPVWVLTAAPSQSLAAELHRLLPDLRAVIGPDRRATVDFDRGGYSPSVFTEILTAGFDVLTYFKGTWARTEPTRFAPVDFTAPDGTAHTYDLAERLIDLPVPAQPATGGQGAKPASTLRLRLIVRRSPRGHQAPILTNRTDLSAAQVAHRMAARWRQENYFEDAREHFALDALDSYADQPDDPTRMVPNPAKAYAGDQVSGARAKLAAAHGGVVDAIDAAGIRARLPGSGGKATVDPAAGQALSAAITDLAAAKATSATTASHLPLGQVRPGSQLLETETKLLTHAIRMSAYNSESALARLLRPHYARGDDEARALLREAFTLSGDLQITGTTLHVRLDPPSAPRRSKALAALCTDLTDTATCYPGTDLTLAYGIKGHTDLA